ncbi:DUF7133 domain-containing protein [Lignipirellula cremea]|uniref:Cytochrome c n=1 Tax=Lignipirellula cremea TaxID=2528010 RepID=A0A518DU49_9BACT|nr:c-type cytochrome [Lignipirellula cremea]QDU95356.1 Cytochrome c [Lignipirellula cremea]
MMRTAILFLGLMLSLGSATLAAESQPPHWIWSDVASHTPGTIAFRREFPVEKRIKTATLRTAAAYAELQLSLNGERLPDAEPYADPYEVDVAPLLHSGQNSLLLKANPVEGPSAFFFTLTLVDSDGVVTMIRSDAECLYRTSAASDWRPAADLGVIDPLIWGGPDVEVSAIEDYTQWKRALGESPQADPASFLTRDGFRVELVKAATAEEGSWVGLTFDPQGRLIVAREDQGLLRMTLNKKGRVVKVETINDKLMECRGLLFAFGDLYVNANGSKALYRLRDTNGDDQFDEVRLQHFTAGNTGHGRNDLALGPDNMIYAIHGDSVELPRDFVDYLSPFREHSRGETTREGYVYRTDREGKKWELVTAGLRNPFGIAFNRDGQMFTYDADAEFDMGSPWYRPTRVNHLVVGGDYGWRGVTGTWPPYYPNHPDNGPPTLDVGKGSPTGVQFGDKSSFPPEYQQAMYALDWAYGRIVAVHMQPQGASYAARPATFLQGRPLNVTNLDFGPDGAMYIATGGRKTQSGVYRVRYIGKPQPADPPTVQQQAVAKFGRFSRGLREELERLPTPSARSIELLWPHLASADPSRRYAARIALERQPLELWQAQALEEQEPTSALACCLALARSGDPIVQALVLQRLNLIDLSSLSVSQQEAALYAYQLCLASDDRPGEEPPKPVLVATHDPVLRRSIRQRLEPLYPARNPRLNQRLSMLLAELQSEELVARTLQLLARTNDQAEQMHYLFVLRNASQGWTPTSRRDYFEALRQMDFFVGGEGMPNFQKKIREDAVAALNDSERDALGDLLLPQAAEEPAPAAPREVVKRWTSELLQPLLAEANGPRNFEQGKAMFAAASCIRCHRMGLTGHPIGPDLTSVARRFTRRDMLESILKPSAAIAENYQTVRVVTTDGKSYVGRVAPGGDYRAPELRLALDPQAPDKVVEILKSEIETFEVSPLSWMPERLLDTLTAEQILDLLAWLESGGDPQHPVYQGRRP